MNNHFLNGLIVCIIIAAVSLYWLPEWALLNWRSPSLWLILGCSTLGLLRRSWRNVLGLLMMGILVTCYMHAQALQLLQQARQVATLKTRQTEFVVEQILHQQGYQTLIAKAPLLPNQPMQRIYLHWQVDQPVQVGERWRGELKLRAISSRLNQGGMDRQQWYFSQHIVASATVKRAVLISRVLSWRDRWFEQAMQQTQGLSQQGLLLALGFGERAWLDAERWQAYQRTNTAHLIAISGLHIGLAMLLGIACGRAIQLCLPTHWITPNLPILCGLILADLYAQLAGFAIPTLRAIVALLIFYLIRLRRDHYSPWQLYFRTVALLLCLDPLMVLSQSFILSASAVFCLILYYQLFPFRLLHWRGKPIRGKFRRLWQLLHLQFGLLWFFTPIQLWLFGGISQYSFLANCLLVPVFSLVLVPIILFALLSNGAFASWQIADSIAQACDKVLAYWQNGWLTLSKQTSLVITILLISCVPLVCYGIYAMPTAKPRWLLQKKLTLSAERVLSPVMQYWLNRLSFALVLLLMIKLIYPHINSPRWRLETLDVGQGLAVLIVKDGHGLLYDSGASWQGGSMAKLEIIPYLQRQGLHLDKLILSHDDNDHAGGVGDLLQQYPQLALITPSQKNYAATDRSFCQQGQQWHWQGLYFQVLSPTEITAKADNHHSCVIWLSDGTHHILLTGDTDKQAERQFLANLPPMDVLQVAHHGSKTSTSQALLQQIQPKVAIISSGRWNPWHFPHQSVLEHLQQHNTAIYNTALSGQVNVQFYQDHIQINTARNAFSPWYQQLIY